MRESAPKGAETEELYQEKGKEEEMAESVSRRAALVGVAAGTLAIVAGSSGSLVRKASAAEPSTGQTEVSPDTASAQYGFLMNASRCINCEKCVEACRLWSRTPGSRPARRRIESYVSPSGKELFVSMSCMHCEKPSCAEVCPAGAISKGPGGIVVVDDELCIGCKYCYQACPFEAPQYDEVGMDKCDCCLGAGVTPGELPHCVRACKTQALRFGELDDLLALSERVRRIGGPTEPSCVLV